jgi:hypothetical protein
MIIVGFENNEFKYQILNEIFFLNLNKKFRIGVKNFKFK